MYRVSFLALISLLLLGAPAAAYADPEPAGAGADTDSSVDLDADADEPEKTTPELCTNRADDDGDGLVDCADADCFTDEVCRFGASLEMTAQTCSDWIDNDGDGEIDCDDSDCQQADIYYCHGSLKRVEQGGQAKGGDAPVVKQGKDVEDLIGGDQDNAGEANDTMCSDGIDNDGDGRIDCADFGCRFSSDVSVCAKRPNIFFSIVAAAGFIADFPEEGDPEPDVRFTRIQMRAIGSIPRLDNSFFLLSFRLERSPRLTFLAFEVPVGPDGHRFSVNSGGGTLSSLGPILSVGKLPLLERPFYLLNAFEGGNGASVEFSGPISKDGRAKYNAFASGGKGVFNGNVGGRFFRDDGENFAWTMGAQVQWVPMGFYDRRDTLYLYTPVPRTLSFTLGGKYDQREIERFPAANGQVLYKHRRWLIKGELYGKYLFDFDALQGAWNVLTSILLVPKHLMFAADVGGFASQEFNKLPPGGFSSLLRRPVDEFQWRVALHWYFFRDIGIVSVLFRDTYIEANPDRPTDPTRERQLRVETQFRF